MDFVKVVFYPENSESISLNCEVAKGFFEKVIGLMNRVSLSNNSGMIFYYFFFGG